MGNAHGYGALLGLAVGDALGTTLEFQRNLDPPRFPLTATGPHTEITGGGPFGLEPGQVTDDTAMACLLAAALRGESGETRGEVERAVPLYVRWPNVRPPDVGGQIAKALWQIRDGVEPVQAGRSVWLLSGRNAAGNRSLMRTTPIGVFFARDSAGCREASFRDSAVTHFDPRCQLACAAFNAAIATAVRAKGELSAEALHDAARRELGEAASLLTTRHPEVVDAIQLARQVLMEDLDRAADSDPQLCSPELVIASRSAGFVRVAFRLAFWELLHAPGFPAGLIDRVNRGGDADTNGAIAGALLGARFGVMGIPARWRHAVFDAPPDLRLGEMAQPCHPSTLFEDFQGLRISEPRGGRPLVFSDRLTKPLPLKRVRLSLSRTFTREEWAAIQKGFWPEEMEDKWFIYAEDGWLYCHRSWTGYCTHWARFEETGDAVHVIEAWASREESQYTATDDARDAGVISWLIDVLLLGRPAAWPDSGLGPLAPLKQWSTTGRAMLAHDTDGSAVGS